MLNLVHFRLVNLFPQRPSLNTRYCGAVVKILSAHHLDETEIRLLQDSAYVDPLLVQKPFVDNFSKPERLSDQWHKLDQHLIQNHDLQLEEQSEDKKTDTLAQSSTNASSVVHSQPSTSETTDSPKTSTIAQSKTSQSKTKSRVSFAHKEVESEQDENCDQSSEENSQQELETNRQKLTQACTELHQVKMELAVKEEARLKDGSSLRQAKEEVNVQKEKVNTMENKLLTSVMKRKMARWRGDNSNLQKRKVRNNTM